MMRLTLAPEPPDFDEKVRKPGQNALALLAGAPLPHPRRGRPPEAMKRVGGTLVKKTLADFPYWQECLEDLHRAYRGICAYYGFYLERANHPAADHRLAKSTAADPQVYEWSNYRLACAHANTCKSNFSDVLDPIDIQDGWFQLDLYDLMVRPEPSLPAATQDRVHRTIERLQLNKERAIETREHAICALRHGADMEYLDRFYPFVARELRRQGVTAAAQLSPLPASVTQAAEPEQRGADDHHP